MKINVAPIVLFVYNRPLHTRQTVEALQKNELANESELFIYSDAAKNENAKAQVQEIRQYIKSIDGFKKVTIVEREKNWGLANNIIDGVTKIANQYGKIIVLEDDLVTSPYFLKFMNDALDFYKNKKKVWHISGWNYPIHVDEAKGTFLWSVMNCWGWATWNDRWAFYEKNVDEIISAFSKKDIKEFNLDGAENFWGQVLANKEGKINTWAIFWYAAIFEKGGLCLNPNISFVRNIGMDGSGVHFNDKINISKEILHKLNFEKTIVFEELLVEDIGKLRLIKNYYKSKKKNIFKMAINKGSRVVLKRNLF